MALTAKPPTNVVLAISSGDTIEATVSPKSRSFTPNDWNVPQTVVVAGVDDESPRISHLADQTLNEDTTATIPFLVSDTESAADVLLVTATCSNLDLIPTVNMALGGSGANRKLSVTPANSAGRQPRTRRESTSCVFALPT